MYGGDGMIELGGNIVLAGFRERDPAELVVVKKLVGTYARRISEQTGVLDRLTVTMKPVHKQGDSEKFELHVKVEAGNRSESLETTDHNLFVALDSVLKKAYALFAK